MPAGLLLCCLSSASAQTPYRIGPPGDWVKAHAPDRQFPVVFIWVALASIVVNILDVAFQQALPVNKPASISGRLLLSAVLWIVYMIRSRRVRNTLIH